MVYFTGRARFPVRMMYNRMALVGNPRWVDLAGGTRRGLPETFDEFCRRSRSSTFARCIASTRGVLALRFRVQGGSLHKNSDSA